MKKSSIIIVGAVLVALLINWSLGLASVPNVGVFSTFRCRYLVMSDMPEYYGAKADGTTDDTTAIRAAIAAVKRVKFSANSYMVTKNINVPAGTDLVGAGYGTIIIQNTPETWSPVEFVLTGYEMFKITGANVTIRDMQLKPIFEAIVGDSVDNSHVTGVWVNGVSNTRSKANGLHFVTCTNVAIDHNLVTGIGTAPTWSTDHTITGYGDGVLIKSCTDAVVSDNRIDYSGRQGISAYECMRATLTSNHISYSGQSAIQIFPNTSSVGGYLVDGNTMENNCADGLDVNWIYSGIAKVDLVVSANRFRKNGYYLGDTTKKGVDGSGIGTYRSISNFSVTGNESYDNRGAGAYITNATNFVIANNIVNMVTATDQPAMFIGTGIADAVISGNHLIAVASGIQFGGTQDIYRSVFKGNTITGLNGLTMPNDANFHNSRVEGNNITTTNAINVVSDFVGNVVNSLSATDNLLFINAAGISVAGNTLTNSSSGFTVTAQNQDALHLVRNKITNTGTGMAVNLNGCTNPVLAENRITADTAGATALRLYSNGSNYCDNVYMGYNYIHSTSGTALMSNFSPNVYANKNTITGTQTINGNAIKNATYA